MSNIAIFHSKISTLDTMHHLYNALKIKSVMNVKNSSCLRQNTLDILGVLEHILVEQHEYTTKNNAVIIIVPKRMLCGDFFMHYLKNVRFFLQNINDIESTNIYLVADNICQSKYFQKNLHMDQFNYIMGNIKECISWYDQVHYKTKISVLFLDHDDVHHYYLGQSCNIVDRKPPTLQLPPLLKNKNAFIQIAAILYDKNLIYYAFYSSLLEENKERSQIADGAVKNINIISNATLLVMNHERQNNITNDLGNIVSNMENL